MAVTSKRKRSVKLDTDTILEAALAVADEAGLEGMSMRRLAERLGADPTAVYRHFRNKDELLVAMADRLFATVADAVPAEGGWRLRAETLIRTARDLYRSHPQLVEVLASQEDVTDSILRINELSLSFLAEAGVPDHEIGLFLEMITVYVVGSGVLDAMWAKGGDDWRSATRRFYASRSPEQYPHSTALAAHLYPPDDEAFDFAVGLLLDTVERRSGGGSS